MLAIFTTATDQLCYILLPLANSQSYTYIPGSTFEHLPCSASCQLYAYIPSSTFPHIQPPATIDSSIVGSLHPNFNPFDVKMLCGNIRVCQGCRGSLRQSDGSIPSPPFDMVAARVERRQFRDASWTLRTPARPSIAHYHISLQCICVAEPLFLPSALHIPADVAGQLTPQHREYLYMQLSILSCNCLFLYNTLLVF